MDFDPASLYRTESPGDVREKKEPGRKLRDIHPPPSAFPFQAYPGNPDPGMPMPRLSYGSRRSSVDSLQNIPRTQTIPNVNQIFRGSVGAALSDSQSSTAIPRNASTSSFRPPFLSPASRNSLSRPSSVVWTPPQYPSLASPSASTSALAGIPPGKPPLPSTRITGRLTKEDKPWLAAPQPRERLSWWITFICILLAIAGAAALCWDGWNQASKFILPGKAGQLCSILDEPWSLDGSTWVREVGLGGWGNGEFQMYTDTNDNSFIQNNQLYIVPTLTSAEIGYGSLFNTTYTLKDCSNSSTGNTDAVVLANTFPILAGNGGGANNGTNTTNSNSTAGNSTNTGNSTDTGNSTSSTTPAAPAGANNIPQCVAVGSPLSEAAIPPVKSARISTKGKVTIDGSKGGKVEIRAKLGQGDWLLNRVRLMPESPDGTYGNGAYGEWPQSGEIDLLLARTNLPSYPAHGSNFVSSSLLYGPFPAADNNAVLQGNLMTQLDGWIQVKRSGFGADFHVYSLEWTPTFMNFYVDSRLQSTLSLQTTSDKESFFNRGNYPIAATNANNGTESVVPNPWQDRGPNAPFDQKFYLVIDLAAGGTNGVFPDNVGGKPWVDGSVSAMLDFANNQPTWSNSWPETVDDKAFRIDYVKMWQVC